YFATPVAYVFLVIFLVLAGILTFYVGDFYERGQADLQPFFVMHPWLYLILVPAITMRMWAEETKGGTLELLLTLPLTLWQAMLGKFLAAWLFIGLALALTFPIWITVNYLGAPDNGVILAGYLGSWLMAGNFIARGASSTPWRTFRCCVISRRSRAVCSTCATCCTSCSARWAGWSPACCCSTS